MIDEITQKAIIGKFHFNNKNIKSVPI